MLKLLRRFACSAQQDRIDELTLELEQRNKQLRLANADLTRYAKETTLLENVHRDLSQREKELQFCRNKLQTLLASLEGLSTDDLDLELGEVLLEPRDLASDARPGIGDSVDIPDHWINEDGSVDPGFPLDIIDADLPYDPDNTK